MKLKYYLRGLGVGIICTAIIMGIALSGNKKEKLTDAEIMERARLLGMVMAGETDSDQEEKESQEQKEESQQKENQDKEKEDTDDKTKTDKAEDTQDKENTGEKDQKDEQEKNDSQTPAVPQPEAEIKTIEIAAGDYSDVVSQKLFEAGLIQDAAAFNAYLTESGADRGITVGMHKIPVGATEEEIIRILGEKLE